MVDVVLRALAMLFVLLLPAAALYAAGLDEPARIVALGTLLAFHFGVFARPIASFGLVLPAAYAAAAITSNQPDGVAALIVAMAAATGAASSLGYHRAVIAFLAAALIGSFEPAAEGHVFARAGMMLCGAIYGYVLVRTAGTALVPDTRAVNANTAMTYSVLLAVLVLIAWLTARTTGYDAWWLPLAVAALGEPWLDVTPARAAARLAIALGLTLVLLMILVAIVDPALRGGFAVLLLVAAVALDHRRPALHGFLLTPVLVLIAGRDVDQVSAYYLQAMVLSCSVVFAFTLLGKWVLWTLRPDAGHVPA